MTRKIQTLIAGRGIIPGTAFAYSYTRTIPTGPRPRRTATCRGKHASQGRHDALPKAHIDQPVTVPSVPDCHKSREIRDAEGMGLLLSLRAIRIATHGK